VACILLLLGQTRTGISEETFESQMGICWNLY